MSRLFSPLALRTVTLPNRIAVSPMCQYSARDGHPNEWHLVHLGSRAVGGAGLVLTAAARRALEAGFRVVEVHAAHGYLLQEFLSPLSNHRADAYGGSLENRTRLVREVAAAVREAVGADVPVFVRISATDWVEGGWTAEDSVVPARDLAALGADVIDVSTGGNVPAADIPIGPGYQVPFAETVRRKTDVPTGAVGMITDARQAERILADGSADLVLLGREFLRDPYWPLHAARQLGVQVDPPRQYARAF